ncbi:MAG TPA: glycosyltransferase family 39 protein [Anaerolineae bacterium]|nr:glycosyltransferase family 39 protein [Anaerolineae bacterium]
MALLFGLAYLLIAFSRIAYPYDLDFLEDSVLMQSARLAEAQPVYAPLNAEFVPHVYMPLYFWLGGLLVKLAGVSFAPLRLISLAATLATAVLIYWIARRAGGLRWVALACAGLWLGGYRLTDGWYELARVDPLFVALSLGGFMLGVYAGASTRRLVVSAVVLALAFLTKQTGVVFALGLSVYLLITVGRRAWLFVGVYAILIVVPVVVLNAQSDGWFNYYAFGIASSNPIEIDRIVNYIRFELFGSLAALSVMALMVGVLSVRRLGLSVIRERPWLIGVTLAVLISGMGRASVGGALNNLMSVYAWLCLSPALLVREWRIIQTTNPLRPMTRAEAAGLRTHEPLRLSSSVLRLFSPRAELLAAAILLQFALGVYNPFRFIPNAELRRSGDRLIARIAAIDGEVFVMMHPYYALLAGKPPSAQIAIAWHARERGVLPLPGDLVDRLQSRYYAAIISDESLFETDPPLAELLEAYYVRSELLTESDAPPTLTGMVVRPQVVYVPRR